MIDDLTTKGVTEPYRIFTSRAEFRLSLRADNADERLTAKGAALGCVGERRLTAFKQAAGRLAEARRLLESHVATPAWLAARGVSINQDGVRRNAFELAAYPTIGLEDLARIWPDLAAVSPAVARRLEADAKYSVYLDRQAEDAARFRRDESIELPPDLDYDGISGLSNELREKFQHVRPVSVGQASRIEGMTPAALALVAAHARRPRAKRLVSARP
jgi:tRNA uridine 5-carboxymethylaminomethyl modification enzyme